jgi:flavin reductase
MDSTRFRQGMKKWLTGVSLVTAHHEGADYGLVSTNLAQVGGEQPTLIICVNRTASSHEPIAKGGAFCVNVLTQAHSDLFERFVKPERREERFAAGIWQRGWRQLPVLPDALACFECEVVDAFPRAAQTIFLGRALEVATHPDAGAEPMVFFNGTLR